MMSPSDMIGGDFPSKHPTIPNRIHESGAECFHKRLFPEAFLGQLVGNGARGLVVPV